MGHQLEIKEMLNLIVIAYLLFDPQGKGFIERSGIEKTLDEHGDKHNHRSNAVLSQQRWAEMVRVFCYHCYPEKALFLPPHCVSTAFRKTVL